MLKKFGPVMIIILLVAVAAGILIQQVDFYEKKIKSGTGLTYEETLEGIMLRVNASRRPSERDADVAWSPDNQPLNREVMRYIILCGPESERRRTNPNFCRKSVKFYESLNSRNFSGSFLPLEEQTDIVDLNTAITWTDEFKVYQRYIYKLIPPNPSPKKLLEIELSYIHMFREMDLIHGRMNNLSECTGDARLFRYYAEMAGLETKYVYAVSLPEYRLACPESGRTELRPYYDNCRGNECDLKYIRASDMGEVRLNGHQAVAVRMISNSKWRIINTSDTSKNGISWATLDKPGKRVFEKSDYRNMVSSDNDLRVVYFHFKEKNSPVTLKPHFIAHVGEDIAFNHQQLMRIYTRAGLSAGTPCVWPVQ